MEEKEKKVRIKNEERTEEKLGERKETGTRES
jgi:hypothetical protein